MFHYIDQPCTPPFTIGLVKAESDIFVRSVENSLERRMLVVAVLMLSVDAYPFLAFSNLTCNIEDTRIGVFLLHCTA